MTDDDPLTVECWMRSFAPATAGPNHERALEALERLEAREPIDSVSVHVWGSAFERTDRRRRVPELERIRTTLAAFEAWAARVGRDLEPFFRTRLVESTITGDSSVVCRLPTLALAEYRDGELVHVAPSRDGDRTVDVLDRLERLLVDDGVDPMLASEQGPTRSGGSLDRSDPPSEDRRRLEPSP